MKTESRAGLYIILVLAAVLVIMGILIREDQSKRFLSPLEDSIDTIPVSQDEIEQKGVDPPPVIVQKPHPLGEVQDRLIKELNNVGLSLYAEGNYEEASEKFREALRQKPRNTSVRRNLAITLGSLGWRQIEDNQYSRALLFFKEAIDLGEDNPTFHTGLALCYLKLNDENRAIMTLKEVITRHRNSPEPYKLLGEIYYLRDEMELSVGYYEKANELDPQDLATTTRLEKARRESTAQSSFQRKATRHFTVKFEGRQEHESARQVMKLLEEAYREIGQSLSVFPSEPITVILYSEHQFKDVTLSPNWSEGLFDGKIRLPIKGNRKSPKLLRKVVRHEYAHALVYEIAKGRTPTWLNEGIALSLEGVSNEGRKKFLISYLLSGGQLKPLEELHGSFMDYSNRQARVAYAQSYWATQHLINRYGLFQVKELLLGLSQGLDFHTVFETKFMKSYPQFEQEWQNEVRQTIQKKT